MHIVVNTRLLLPEKLDGIGWFSHEVLSRITRSMPEHQFTFLFDRPFDERFIYSDNVQGKSLFPPTRHPWLYQFYFEQVVPYQLKALQADLFFSPDGFLTTKHSVKQVPVIHDLNFEHRPQDLPPKYARYYQKYFPLFARKAERILTVSEYSKTDIHKTYGIEKSKIDVAHNGYNPAYRKLSEEEKCTSRKRFAEGEHYFIFVGNFSYRKNIHGIIKAFDHYKQHDGVGKLLLVGNPLWNYAEMDEALKHARFSNDVLFAGRLEIQDLTMAMGAAEALLFPSYFEGFGIPILEAFAAETPVITSPLTAMPEIAAEAAMYAHPENFKKISNHMKDIFHNENQRIKLVRKGKEQLLNFSWDQTANKVKSTLLDTLKMI
ncbi:MAG: glycosyltransferase family 1 protein [Salibacteraceae bacterium]